MRTYAPAPTLAVLERLLEEPSLARGVLHHEVREATDATFGDWPSWLDPRLRAGLAKRGIERPYLHQAAAIEAVHAGRDVVVVTPTASGKSLCYTAPVLQALAEDPSARALFLFPTKALGQDQVAETLGARQGRGPRGLLGLLRRGHARADPIGDPEGRTGRRDQPGHAPLRDPPPPHQVVPAVRAAARDRHRRAAHLSRRVRQPRRQRAAPPAPPVRPLREPPGHRLLLGDHREPGGAGADPHRPADAPDRSQRGPVG